MYAKLQPDVTSKTQLGHALAALVGTFYKLGELLAWQRLAPTDSLIKVMFASFPVVALLSLIPQSVWLVPLGMFVI